MQRLCFVSISYIVPPFYVPPVHYPAAVAEAFQAEARRGSAVQVYTLAGVFGACRPFIIYRSYLLASKKYV